MAVTQPLAFTMPKDLKGTVPIIPLPQYVNHRSVTTAEAETVPALAQYVIFSGNADAWISDGTAVVPASDVTDGTGSFFVKAGAIIGFAVTPGQTISVISASGTLLASFAYYLHKP